MAVGSQVADDEDDWDFPTDVFAEILRRLPALSRRRLRLVSRVWRDVVDARAPAVRSRAKPLLWDPTPCAVYVIDDLSSTEKTRRLWSAGGRHAYDNEGPNMVGACNGLLCVCDNSAAPGGALTVAIPETGETLPVPPLPFAAQFIGRYQRQEWHRAYSFTYSQTTGQYKVVHVPCFFDKVHEFKSLQPLTLGEASWLDVPVPYGTRCALDGVGIISVNDTTYWVAEANGKIISFDLNDESVKPVVSLPMLAGWKLHLTEVHGRLGMATKKGTWPIYTEVWVLERERGAHIWRRRYSIQDVHAVVYGDYVLARKCSSGSFFAYGNTSLKDIWTAQTSVVSIRGNDHGMQISNSNGCQAFAYVETTEPLSVYKLQ